MSRQLKRLDLTGDSEAIFREFDDRGGVVWVVVFSHSGESIGDYELHRIAAYTTGGGEAAQIRQLPGGSYDCTIPDRMGHGERISLREFMGPRYDWTKKCLILRGRSSEHLYDFFPTPYVEFPGTIFEFSEEVVGVGNETGFAFAVSAPAHPLHWRNTEINACFDRFSETVFGGLSEDTIIHSWPTEWSDRFEAGREWWGTFLWTLENPGSKVIFGIGASTTD